MSLTKVAIVTGGYSSEAEISIQSASTIKDNLSADKYTTYLVIVTKNEWFVQLDNQKTSINKEDFSFELNGKTENFDCAFIAIHGTPGEDGKMQAYFDMINLPYSGSNHLASAITFNKWTCNSILKSLGIPVADSIILRKGESISAEAIVNQLSLPVFIKPNDGGSSFGISKAKKNEEIQAAIKNAFEEGDEVIIEQFIEGTEVTNGVFRNSDNEIHPLPVTEIVTENEFFDYDAKYKGESREITPARISDDLTQKIQEITAFIYQKINLGGVARIDYLIKDNIPHVIEINTIPGMSQESIVPKMAKVEGIGLSELYEAIIKEGLNR